MWQYIVLGQIPGTSIYLSFQTVLFIGVSFGALYIAYKKWAPRRVKNAKQSPQDIAL